MVVFQWTNHCPRSFLAPKPIQKSKENGFSQPNFACNDLRLARSRVRFDSSKKAGCVWPVFMSCFGQFMALYSIEIGHY